MDKKMNIKELFYSLQNEMLAEFTTNKLINHPGTKGDATEIEWINWLRTYLPERYKVDKAIIIDHTGATSDQIDVVIYDRQYSPLVFNNNGTKYIPAESIYAVFEVKQDLNKKHLDYASGKVESVRKLQRTSAPIPYANGTYKPKNPFTIIGGILTINCSWKEGFSSKSFNNIILSYSGNKQIDIGCSLENGSFVLENSSLRTSTQNESLIYFFIQLNKLLQQKATVPAIDIMHYAKSLDSI